MSQKTWMSEHYPVSADRLVKQLLSDESINSVQIFKEVIEHSLLKWQGLRRDALKKHSVTLKDIDYSVIVISDKPGIEKPSFLEIDSSSCSLCHVVSDDCSRCLLSESDELSNKSQTYCHRAYGAFLDTGNPGQMIGLLRDALDALNEGELDDFIAFHWD